MNELLPKQRPNLSLSMKYKGSRVIKALALHEAHHAFVRVHQGESVLGLNMAAIPPETYGGSIPLAQRTRFYAAVTLADNLPRESKLAGGIAGAVANELCGIGDGLAIEGDVQQAIFVALSTVMKSMSLVAAGEERSAFDVDCREPIDRSAIFERIRVAWCEAIEIVTDPQSFGAIHAIANAALKHTRLNVEQIKRLIETAEPFAAPLLQKRRAYILAKAPAIWEREAATLIDNHLSGLNWQ